MNVTTLRINNVLYDLRDTATEQKANKIQADATALQTQQQNEVAQAQATYAQQDQQIANAQNQMNAKQLGNIEQLYYDYEEAEQQVAYSDDLQADFDELYDAARAHGY